MTEIPLKHFIIFSSGVYNRLKYLLDDKKGHRMIISPNKKGWNTFVHLIQWGMAGVHNIKVKGKKIHGYKDENGIVWGYTEDHVERILFIFKELGIIDFYYYKKKTDLPRTNLNSFSKENQEHKVVPYERIFSLKQIDNIEFEYEMKKYLSNNSTTINPKGLLA